MIRNHFLVALPDVIADCAFASLCALPRLITSTIKHLHTLHAIQILLPFARKYTQTTLQLVQLNSQSSPSYVRSTHHQSLARVRYGARRYPHHLPGAGDKEDTVGIVTLPTCVTFQPGTTAGRIFAKRSVLMDLQPGIVSDVLLSVFHTNPTLNKVVLKLNDANTEKVRAGVDQRIPKGKHDKPSLGTALAKEMVRRCCS